MRCSSCGNKARGRTSPLGSPLCNACYDQQYGALLGRMTGNSVAAAATGPGIVRWIREAMTPSRKKGKPAAPHPEQEEPEDSAQS